MYLKQRVEISTWCYDRLSIQRIFCLLLVTVVFLTVLFPVGYSTGSEVPDYLIQLVSAGSKAIQSGMGDLVIRITYTDYGRSFLSETTILPKTTYRKGMIQVAMDKTTEVFFAFEGRKVRWNERFTAGDIGWITESWNAFDGEQGMKMDLSRSIGDISVPTGQILSELSPSPGYDPRNWGGTGVEGIALHDLLLGVPLGESNKAEVVLLGTDECNGAECYVVQVNFDNSVWKLWLNPNRNYRPSKVINRSESLPFVKDTELGSKDYLFLTNIRYGEYENGVWFPQESVSQFYTVDRSTEEQKLVREEIRTADDNFKLNIDVPDSLFEINFIEGQQVYDQRLGKTIIWPGE